MLNFRPEGERAHQPTRGLMGLIATSFLGTRGTRCLSQAHPFTSRLGDTQVSQGLALINILFTNMYLGSETTLALPGVSLVALTPGWGRGQKPLLCVLQVSICFNILHIYSNDIAKGIKSTRACFVRVLTSLT